MTTTSSWEAGCRTVDGRACERLGARADAPVPAACASRCPTRHIRATVPWLPSGGAEISALTHQSRFPQ